jgi:hypothetical protein
VLVYPFPEKLLLKAVAGIQYEQDLLFVPGGPGAAVLVFAG